MARIHVVRVAESGSHLQKLLLGLTVEAIRFGPFKLPPIPKGGVVSVTIAFGYCPSGLMANQCWIVELLALYESLREAGRDIDALRLKRQYDLRPFGFRQVITLPIHPEFEIEELVA